MQSAISQSAQGLEAVLGVQLFDRDAKTPRLTDVGRALLVQARQVLALADALRMQAASIAAGLEPELTIAVDNLFPSAPLIDGLHALRRQFPELPVTLFTERSWRPNAGCGGEMPMWRCAGCGRGPRRSWWSNRLCRSRWRRSPRLIGLESLRRHVQLVLTDPAAGDDGPSFGVISPRVWRFVELERRLDFLKGGFGWANMPLHMVRGFLQAGVLVRLQLAEPTLAPGAVPISAVHRRDRPPGPATRWFLDHLVRTCKAP